MPTNNKHYNLIYQRDYRKSGDHLAEMAQRQRARRKAEKEGRVVKGGNTEVDHKNGVKGGNGKSNLQILSRTENRRKGVQKAIASRKSRMRNGGKY